MLDNIFEPLFAVTKDPASHPQLHVYLSQVGNVHAPFLDILHVSSFSASCMLVWFVLWKWVLCVPQALQGHSRALLLSMFVHVL